MQPVACAFLYHVDVQFSDSLSPRADRVEAFEVWCSTVRAPARAASEGQRQVAVPGAEAEYEIAELDTDRWAVRVRLAYLCGNASGQGIPWQEQPTREACIDAFLNLACTHFGRELHERDPVVSDSQRRAQRMMLELLGGGLFGFIEPTPEIRT